MNELKLGDLIIMAYGSMVLPGVVKKLDSKSLQYFPLSENGYKKFRCDIFNELLSYDVTVDQYRTRNNGVYNYKGKQYKLGDKLTVYHKGTIAFTLPKRYPYYKKITSFSLNNEELQIFNKFKKDLDGLHIND